MNRSSLYYEAVEPDEEELALMRRIDEIHLKHLFFGSRKIRQTLKEEGIEVNRKRVAGSASKLEASVCQDGRPKRLRSVPFRCILSPTRQASRWTFNRER